MDLRLSAIDIVDIRKYCKVVKMYCHYWSFQGVVDNKKKCRVTQDD